MFNKLIRGFNCLVINNFKFIIIKIFHYNRFKFHFLNLVSPLVKIDFQGKGKILIGKQCNVLANNIIGVRENGLIELKDGVYINKNCQIISHKKITIGENTCIGPNTVIVDHDHKFGINGVIKKEFNSKQIAIGNNVWIGANCVIAKGITIGNNAIIGAGTVLTKDVPPNTVVYQKRENVYREIDNGDIK